MKKKKVKKRSKANKYHVQYALFSPRFDKFIISIHRFKRLRSSQPFLMKRRSKKKNILIELFNYRSYSQHESILLTRHTTYCACLLAKLNNKRLVFVRLHSGFCCFCSGRAKKERKKKKTHTIPLHHRLFLYLLFVSHILHFIFTRSLFVFIAN